MIHDVPLPGMPEPPPVDVKPPPAGVRAQRYRPRRSLCSDCVWRIHSEGVAAAPYPSQVQWQVSKGALTLFLCTAHKIERLESWK